MHKDENADTNELRQPQYRASIPPNSVLLYRNISFFGFRYWCHMLANASDRQWMREKDIDWEGSAWKKVAGPRVLSGFPSKVACLVSQRLRRQKYMVCEQHILWIDLPTEICLLLLSCSRNEHKNLWIYLKSCRWTISSCVMLIICISHFHLMTSIKCQQICVINVFPFNHSYACQVPRRKSHYTYEFDPFNDNSFNISILFPPLLVSELR